MQRSLFGIPISLLLLGGLTSCSSVGSKSASLTIIYIITAVLALLVLFGYLLFEKKKDAWLVWLFSCVSVVNVGYFLLSVSKNLEWALMANRLSYLGSVFLPLAMLVIILRTTGTRYTKWLTGTLFLLGVAVFVIAASPGVLDIYYKEVTFEIIGGSGTLIKVYGPLHPIYLFYLVGYFGSDQRLSDIGNGGDHPPCHDEKEDGYHSSCHTSCRCSVCKYRGMVHRADS